MFGLLAKEAPDEKQIIQRQWRNLITMSSITLVECQVKSKILWKLCFTFCYHSSTPQAAHPIGLFGGVPQ